MRTLGHRNILDVIADSAMGACCGAVLYGVYGSSTMHHGIPFNPNLLVELPLWLIVMAATTWPVAFGSAAAGRMGRSAIKPWSLAALPSMAAVCVAASMVAFEWYMHKTVPAINWSRGWLLPLASSSSAFVFGYIRVGYPVKRILSR